jgi:DNA-binding IclR family transcriptional regulator
MAKERYQIQSVARALSILELLSATPNLGVTEVGEKLRLHKSTVFGLLSTLEQKGYVNKDAESGKYNLSMKMFELGSAVFEELDLRKIARPHLEQIVDKHHETAHLVVPDKTEIVYIDKVECTQSIRISSRVGQRMPFHCTGVGKAILAHLPEANVKTIVQEKGLIPFTDNTITSYAELKEELEKIRRLGYAIDNEEIERDLVCIAAPIRDYNGKVIAAASVSGPKMRMNDEKLKAIVGDLIDMAERISAELGFSAI